MASFLKKFGLGSKQQSAAQSPTFDSPRLDYGDGESKNGGFAVNGRSTSNEEPKVDAIIAPGELSFEEGTSGGLGRHLGLFSTTLLM